MQQLASIRSLYTAVMKLWTIVLQISHSGLDYSLLCVCCSFYMALIHTEFASLEYWTIFSVSSTTRASMLKMMLATVLIACISRNWISAHLNFFVFNFDGLISPGFRAKG
ncbi:MAG: hypothetical protein HDT37_05435 [Clostridiales bacterium]|nr:hypothetical protein [Clostridiales bacterium]